MLLQILAAWIMIWLIVYVVSDSAQAYLYNEAAEGLWWRTLAMAAPAGMLLVWFPCRLDTMFTEYILASILQPIIWWLLFEYLCGFHRPHAICFALAMFFLFGFAVTLALDSLFGTVAV